LRDTLYALRNTAEPIEIEYGKGYQIQVAAVDDSNDGIGIVGPRSEPSEIVWCGPKPWDLNNDKVCDILDIQIIGLNLGKRMTPELDIKAKAP